MKHSDGWCWRIPMVSEKDVNKYGFGRTSPVNNGRENQQDASKENHLNMKY